MFGWALIVCFGLVLVIANAGLLARLNLVLNGIFAAGFVFVLVYAVATDSPGPNALFWIGYPLLWLIVCGGLRAVQAHRQDCRCPTTPAGKRRGMTSTQG
jgi:hypothetical protein